ncbi:arylamine N-acetyltransferase 1 [Dothidotthia symphoricarpi CBS 119687]|uniref:Arylamine N-acetyltransferase 1 n=1 Tax=Dothidotthia symphoricarpi CBS 119687 TaxID=1392245 RepID=A0A6A6AET6_9PLEO|nr:arylamine N-acetyltransferase 1 [Dothidotthia symphoricarpi CBS 119687]KAF2130409.1 arylamine N-acetyltransferase 1 [Dothidotthia symphoricarpi CBS 119687]
MASSPPLQPTYSPSQISQYLTHLKIPSAHHHDSIQHLSPQEALCYLTLLQTHHLSQVPFENLTLHYSPHRQISLQPSTLFAKVVGDNNNRGGYCMENNALFGTLLRSLGFSVYSAGARVWSAGHWTGWSHMVNLVTIGGEKYHVDVGFGAEGPVVPMRLQRDGEGVLEKQVSPATAKLQWRGIPGTTDAEQRLWVYSYRRDAESELVMRYCFSEMEFLPGDYGVMNYHTSTSPKTFFTRTIVVEKKILREGELVGSLILGDRDAKRRVGGVKEKEIRFESEDERLKALEEWFGIRFGEAEREGIRGLASEIE